MSAAKSKTVRQGMDERGNRKIRGLTKELEGAEGRADSPGSPFTMGMTTAPMLENGVQKPEVRLDRLIRIKEVLEIVPVGRSTWWDGVRCGRYPAPVHLGARITAWKLSNVVGLVNGTWTASGVGQ